MNFSGTWSNLFKHCISAVRFFADRSLSIDCSTKGPVHCSFRTALSNSYFGKVLLMNFASAWNKKSHFCQFFAGESLYTGSSTKEAVHCCFHKAL